MEEEETLWQGRPSQILNLGNFIFAAILFVGLIIASLMFLPQALAVAPIAIVWGAWQWLSLRSQRFELTTERLRLTEGVFDRKTDELELFRVKDSSIEEPFFLRSFGLGILKLETSDRSHPLVALKAIPEVAEVGEKIRKQVEILRRTKGVREVDFGGD